MRKITVVGAGNVGATCASVLAHKDIVKEVVLLDIMGNLARGKALDMWQQAPIDYYSTFLQGSDNYEDTAGSDIVVITAGAGGSHVWTADGTYLHQPAFPCRVTDTTGCGDVYHGSFLEGWLKGWPVERCAGVASRQAALTTEKLGGRHALRLKL